MINEIDNKMTEMAKEIGMYNAAFDDLDTQSKALAIRVFAHMSNETEVEAMCKKIQEYLN